MLLFSVSAVSFSFLFKCELDSSFKTILHRGGWDLFMSMLEGMGSSKQYIGHITLSSIDSLFKTVLYFLWLGIYSLSSCVVPLFSYNLMSGGTL